MIHFKTLDEALTVIETLEDQNRRLQAQVEDWRDRALAQESLNDVEYLRTAPGDWSPEDSGEGWIITVYARDYWLYTRPKQSAQTGSGH